MATTRPLCVGFSSATRVARFQLGNLEVRFYDKASKRWCTFGLSGEGVRRVDRRVGRWRRDAHGAGLLTMNGGEVNVTFNQSAEAGALRDTV